MDNEPAPTTDGSSTGHDEFDDELEALRQSEMGATDNQEMEDEDLMETFATQTQTIEAPMDFDDDDELVEVDPTDEPSRPAVESGPPVFRPITVSLEDNLAAAVKRRMRKGHEAILEEQPKWSLLAKVLKEIEDTIARVAETHADAPGTNIVLIMTSSDRTCLQLRQYLTTMQQTDPPFGPQAGRKMMETLFLSNWQHEKNGERLTNPARMDGLNGADEVQGKKGELEEKRDKFGRRGVPAYKRRRLRGGATALPGRNSPGEKDL